MMAFLLFQPLPRDVLMIGLGGGSMARYIHQRMPGTRTTVVEINAKVLAAARSMFHFPADDARLKVEIADGADYVLDNAESADVLLVDGFDDGKQPTVLCAQAFYDAACAALPRAQAQELHELIAAHPPPRPWPSRPARLQPFRPSPEAPSSPADGP